MEFEVAADDPVPLGPEGLTARSGRRRTRGAATAGRLRVARRAVIRIAGRVDSRDALAAADEFEERPPARIGAGLVVRVVEETAGRAVEHDGVVLFQVLCSEIREIVGGRRRPRAGFLAELLDRPRRHRD